MSEYHEVVSPVGPLVTSSALVIGVTQAVLVEQFPELGIILIEKVFLTDAQPLDLRALLELGDQLCLQVIIDVTFAFIHTTNGRRTQTDISKIIGLVGTDIE